MSREIELTVPLDCVCIGYQGEAAIMLLEKLLSSSEPIDGTAISRLMEFLKRPLQKRILALSEELTVKIAEKYICNQRYEMFIKFMSAQSKELNEQFANFAEANGLKYVDYDVSEVMKYQEFITNLREIARDAFAGLLEEIELTAERLNNGEGNE